jgi:hypothetical protein
VLYERFNQQPQSAQRVYYADNVVMLFIDHQAAIFEGDHKVHVIQVSHDTLTLDRRFEPDFNTAFEHPARPHGIAMKYSARATCLTGGVRDGLLF